MIRASGGLDVLTFIHRIAGAPERYAEVVICSPFIDAQLVPLLARMALSARRGSCGVRFVTGPEASKALARGLVGHPASWRRSIIVRRRLHAKAYVAIAREGQPSEAIVTSANLTRAGVEENIELGISADSSSEPGRTIVRQVYDSMKRLMNGTRG